jgi:Protein of unknown function (DUF4230)
MKQIWLILLSMIALTLGVVMYVKDRLDPLVETIVASSLKAVQEQSRLSTFAARFVTDVTSSKQRYGLSAQKTLIIPAMVRYEVDLAKLKQDDVSWDASAKMLRVKLPPVEITGPEFDLTQTREYESGAVLMTLTDVEKMLDTENRAKARADLIAQAKAEPMMRLARAATERAVVTSFAMPLRAAGVEANVKVEFR